MIFYSHVNEDNGVEYVEMAALPIRDLYVVAGSGERVIALLDHSTLENIYILDTNPEALYLCEIKICALKHLPIKEYLEFIGFDKNSKNRWKLFEQFKEYLSENAKSFWLANRILLEQGVCNCGHFEQFLQKARPIFKWFLGPKFYQCFNKKSSLIVGFPHIRWNIVKFFFSFKMTYYLLGMKDEAFVSNQSTLSIIPNALQKSIDEDKVAQSCLFHMVFNGHLEQMPTEYLPLSFQESRLEKIKIALQHQQLKVHYLLGDALELVNKIENNSNENRFFSLSDLLSFVGIDYLNSILMSIKRLNCATNTVIFRSFIRNRLSTGEISQLSSAIGPFVDFSSAERTNFYQVLKVNLVKK